MINLLIYILLVRLVFVADFLWDILFPCIFSQYFYCFLFLLCEAVYMKPDYPVDGTSLNLNYLVTYPVDGMFSKMYIYIQYTIIQKGREVCFFMGWLPYRFRAGLSATFQGLTLLGWAAIYKCQCCRLLVDLMCNVVSGHITDLRPCLFFGQYYFELITKQIIIPLLKFLSFFCVGYLHALGVVVTPKRYKKSQRHFGQEKMLS